MWMWPGASSLRRGLGDKSGVRNHHFFCCGRLLMGKKKLPQVNGYGKFPLLAVFYLSDLVNRISSTAGCGPLKQFLSTWRIIPFNK